MPVTPARLAWDKANTQCVNLRLMRSTDADILAKLATVGNKQGYIKQLIRADLAAEGRQEHDQA
jgi:hypothetical protein